jgi:hypothetical protein
LNDTALTTVTFASGSGGRPRWGTMHSRVVPNSPASSCPTR